MKRIGAEVEPTFAALFDISVAKDVLLHFWSSIRSQLPLVSGAGSLRPEDLIGALAADAQGTVRPGKLLQQVGCLMLVDSVGVRGLGAIMSRHCSSRTWQRYKRQLGDLELPDCGNFSALRQVDKALGEFKPLNMKSFHGAPGCKG